MPAIVDELRRLHKNALLPGFVAAKAITVEDIAEHIYDFCFYETLDYNRDDLEKIVEFVVNNPDLLDRIAEVTSNVISGVDIYFSEDWNDTIGFYLEAHKDDPKFKFMIDLWGADMHEDDDE